MDTINNDRLRLVSELSNSTWNRRLMNLYWICNAIILAVELVVGAIYYGTNFIPPFPVYLRRFVFIPSVTILLLTAGCEFAVRRLSFCHKHLSPYIVTFTCVAYCAVLLIVHYSVNVIFIVYIMPLFFSLVYKNKRVLLYTFIFSCLVFIAIYFGYFLRVSLPYLYISIADIPTNIALLVISYLVCSLILNRFDEILSDLTQAEHLAYEADTAKKRAESIAEARTRFLANMSHEIRTPMNGIIGLSELALNHTDTTEWQRDYLTKIKTSADGLLSVIDSILDIAKIDAGEASLEKIPFDLHAVLGECEAIISHKAAEKGLCLYFYDETMLTSKLIGDPTKLRQAILNFLANAVKFTKKGSITLTARLDTQPASDGAVRIYFEVGDTGIGMTEEQCARVFEPFVQADNSIARSYGGTGLGLAISKSIIGLMGGEISVKSIPDIGSRFSFSVELELSSECIMTDNVGKHSIIRPIFEGDVLLCEDDEINQHVALINLEKLGLRVTLADNGHSGIDAVLKRMRENKPFDLIIMDINMPVMDGLNAAKKIVAMGVRTPIIAMTAVAMAEDRERFLDAGMTGYLCKPFKAQDLWRCLSTYLTPVRYVDDNNDWQPRETVSENGGYTVSFDTDFGIESFFGNRQAYLQALGTYIQKYSDSPMKLEISVNNKDYSYARKLAHTEKGAAAVLGAHRLSELLAILEEAFRKDCVYYSADVMEQYKKEHSRVLDLIVGFQQQNQTNSKETPQ